MTFGRTLIRSKGSWRPPWARPNDVTKSGVMQKEVGDDDVEDEDVGLLGELNADCCCCLNLSKDMKAEAVEDGDRASPAC